LRNAHFPKVEASNKQVETQNGGNLTNNNKSTTTRNKKVMGEDKKKEVERQRKIRLDKKTKNKRLEAFCLGIGRKKRIQRFSTNFLPSMKATKAQTRRQNKNKKNKKPHSNRWDCRW
jgi:hypothetical protein